MSTHLEPDIIDRNLTELLLELRVTQTGVQIPFAFLLSLPFTQRGAALLRHLHDEIRARLSTVKFEAG
jgi:hypothetical protein